MNLVYLVFFELKPDINPLAARWTCCDGLIKRPHPRSDRSNRSGSFRRETDSTFSDSGNGPYEVIEYDLDRDRGDVDVFDLDTLHIDDDSPAAQALAANANVKVSSLGKAARAVHMQTVRKIVKRATGTTRSGVTRGKPPRLPPTVDGGLDYPSTQLDRIEESEGEEDHHAHEHIMQSGVEVSHIPAGVVPGTAEAGKKGKS